MRTRRHPATVLLFVLPVLLLLGAVVLAVGAGRNARPEPSTGPLALPPVEAPDAGAPACTALLAALPAALPVDQGVADRLPLAAPAPAGAQAWAPGGDRRQPVVLRCGLPRPAELTPTSQLIVINGVSWLNLPEPDRDTFIAVDRAVYLALTVPRPLGTGPVQTVSDTVRAALPPR